MHAHRHGITGAKAGCHLGSEPLHADAWPLTARTAQVICVIVAALASCRVQLTPGPQRQGRRRLFFIYSLLLSHERPAAAAWPLTTTTGQHALCAAAPKSNQCDISHLAFVECPLLTGETLLDGRSLGHAADMSALCYVSICSGTRQPQAAQCSMIKARR